VPGHWLSQLWRAGEHDGGATLRIAFVMPVRHAPHASRTGQARFYRSRSCLNPAIKVIADNAQGSDAAQISQVEDALVNGASVIVVSPLDLATGVAIVSKAAKYNVPVIAYDGLSPVPRSPSMSR